MTRHEDAKGFHKYGLLCLAGGIITQTSWAKLNTEEWRSEEETRFIPGGLSAHPIRSLCQTRLCDLHTVSPFLGWGHLTLKGERNTHLVTSFIERFGVERKTKADGGAGVELGAVGESCNAAVVDLGLSNTSESHLSPSHSSGRITHLGKGQWVQLVLGGELQTASFLCLHVVPGLGTNLDSRVDLLVIAGSNLSQVLRADDAGHVARSLVTETERVASDSGLLDIVTRLTTDEEAVRAGNDINDGVNVALGGRVVDECA